MEGKTLDSTLDAAHDDDFIATIRSSSFFGAATFVSIPNRNTGNTTGSTATRTTATSTSATTATRIASAFCGTALLFVHVAAVTLLPVPVIQIIAFDTRPAILQLRCLALLGPALSIASLALLFAELPTYPAPVAVQPVEKVSV